MSEERKKTVSAPVPITLANKFKKKAFDSGSDQSKVLRKLISKYVSST